MKQAFSLLPHVRIKSYLLVLYIVQFKIEMDTTLQCSAYEYIRSIYQIATMEILQ